MFVNGGNDQINKWVTIEGWMAYMYTFKVLPLCKSQFNGSLTCLNPDKLSL